MVKMVDNLESWIQKAVNVVYDDSMSLYELVSATVAKLNELIDQSNEYFSQDLTTYTTNILTGWKNDGTLNSIIEGSVFTDMNTRLTTTQTNLTNYQTSNDAAVATNTTNIATNAQKVGWFGVPEAYGAKGDGVTDDTAAINACLAANLVSLFRPTDYLITGSIKNPKNHSIDGNRARFKVGATFTPNAFGASVPVNTVLYMEAREPVNLSEEDMATSFVRNLRIKGSASLNLTGMYLGYRDQNLVTQGTSVNYSVAMVDFKNIYISSCKDGMTIGEAWQCAFDNVQTSYITNNALTIQGQSVNNTFTKCVWSTATQGQHGVYITHGNYNGSLRRPEGNTFVGGFIGSTVIGVRIIDAFVTKFKGVIIDINTLYAALIENASGNISDDTMFENCYLYSTGALVANIGDGTAANLIYFKNCNFTGATDNILVGQNQVAKIEGCQLTNKVTFAGNAHGHVINNIWNQVSTGNAQIIKNGSNVVVAQNIFKLDGAAVVAA